MPPDYDLELKRLLFDYKDLSDRQTEIDNAITALGKEKFNNTFRLANLQEKISRELRKYNFEKMTYGDD